MLFTIALHAYEHACKRKCIHINFDIILMAWIKPSLFIIIFLILTWERFLKLIFRERGRKGERKRKGEEHECERETSISCLLYAPWLGTNPQPSYVPWPGIEPVPLWCTGWSFNQHSHPAGEKPSIFNHPPGDDPDEVCLNHSGNICTFPE